MTRAASTAAAAWARSYATTWFSSSLATDSLPSARLACARFAHRGVDDGRRQIDGGRGRVSWSVLMRARYRPRAGTAACAAAAARRQGFAVVVGRVVGSRRRSVGSSTWARWSAGVATGTVGVANVVGDCDTAVGVDVGRDGRLRRRASSLESNCCCRTSGTATCGVDEKPGTSSPLPSANVHPIGSCRSACLVMFQRASMSVNTARARYSAPSSVKCMPSEMRAVISLPFSSRIVARVLAVGVREQLVRVEVHDVGRPLRRLLAHQLADRLGAPRSRLSVAERRRPEPEHRAMVRADEQVHHPRDLQAVRRSPSRGRCRRWRRRC